MKLDTRTLRYLTADDWRVLTAVEMGSKNHEIVPTSLISQIAGLRGGSGVHKSISTLAKANLIARVPNAKYDGYRLTYGGLDYLALHAHSQKGVMYSVGNQIGVGKESDIYVVSPLPESKRQIRTLDRSNGFSIGSSTPSRRSSISSRISNATRTSVSTSSSTATSVPTPPQLVLKIHRLGRISFRSVKNNRDYLRNRHAGSWLYLSRLSALKEYSFLSALHAHGFPVPRPIAHNRHTLVMELVDEGRAPPLRQVKQVADVAGLYAELMSLIVRLARVGLIHGDFNEFNILLKETPITSEGKSPGNLTSPEIKNSERQREDSTDKVLVEPILIDFPQMLSTSHANARMYFDRDVNCIKRFFSRRFHFTSDEPGPTFDEAIREPLLVPVDDPAKNTAETETRASKIDDDAASPSASLPEAVSRSEVAPGTGPAVPSTNALRPLRLDIAVEATGFSRKMAHDLERYQAEAANDNNNNNNGSLDANSSPENDSDNSDSSSDSSDDHSDNDNAKNSNNTDMHNDDRAEKDSTHRESKGSTTQETRQIEIDKLSLANDAVPALSPVTGSVPDTPSTATPGPAIPPTSTSTSTALVA